MIPQPIDQVPLFLKLSEEERELLTSRLRHHQYTVNEPIFGAGKPAEMLCVVASGWVKLESDTPNGPILLASLGAGSVLGEVDCLLKKPYSTSARAGSQVDLLTLSRTDLESLILEHPTIGIKFSAALGTRIAYLDDYLTTQRLAAQPLFSGLVQNDLQALAAQLEFHTLARGETLLEEGAAVDSAYLLESGCVRSVTATQAGDEYSEVGEGEWIGHQSLLTDKPFHATVFALSDLEFWTLKRSALQDLIAAHPAIHLAFSRALSDKLCPEDQPAAVARLQALPLFSNVDSAAMQDLVSHLVLQQYPAGEWVYTGGTPGDAMYYVESGEIALFDDASGTTWSGRRGPGETLGEMALLTGRTREQSARAQANTTLWVLYKNDYDDLLVQHPAISMALGQALTNRLAASENEFADKHLRSLKLFQGLSTSELAEIARVVQPAKFRSGEVVCYAGEPLKDLYLIESGDIRLIMQIPNGQVVTLDTLGAGESFGEAAIVQNTAQNLTAQAITDVDLWAIRQPDFEQFLGQHPVLMLNVTRRMAEQAQRATDRLATVNVAPPRMTGMPTPPPRPFAGRPVAPMVPAPPASRPMTANTGRMPMPPARRNLVPAAPAPVPSAPEVQPAPGVRTVPARPWDRRGGTIVRPLPAAASRPVPVKQNGGMFPGAPMRNSTTANWFSSLSGATKVQMAVIGLLVAVLVCVVVPLTVLSVASNLLAAPSTPSNDLPMNDLGGPQQAVKPKQPISSIFKLAMQETPVPTAAPKAVIAPTQAPTKTPTRKPVPPPARPTQPGIGGPVPNAGPTTNAPAAAAAPKAPPLPAVAWDARLGPGGLPLLQGIHIEKASVLPGQKFWMITKVKFEDAGAESGNDHTIYITILDEDGKRVSDATATVSWDESGSTQVQRLTVMDQKPAGDYCQCNYNWPMYGAGYNANVEGLASDKIIGMIMPMHRHVNYKVTFQRLTQP